MSLRRLAYAILVDEYLFFATLARKHKCYLIVPLELLEDARAGLCYNACVVVDRKGETVGIYRKMFPAVQHGTDNMEGGD